MKHTPLFFILPLLTSVVLARPASRLETEIVDRINDERVQRGLPVLQINARLSEAAQEYAAEMGRRMTLSHHLDGSTAGARIAQVGYSWTAWAENIAVGYDGASAVVAGWMNSPGHRDNILDASQLDLADTGVGEAMGADGRRYFCQVFARGSAIL